MAGVAKSPRQWFHASSTSVPSISHPVGLRVEERPNNLKTSMSAFPSIVSAKRMCNALRGLEELYGCIKELLGLPSSQQGLSNPEQRQLVEEELDVSLRLLDLCCTVKDNIAAMKQQVQNLQLALRRTGYMSKVQSCICLVKKRQKDLQKHSKALNQVFNYGSFTSLDKVSDLQKVVLVFRAAREMTISLLQSVIFFMSKPCHKQNWWSSPKKALWKRRVACDEGHDEHTNEVESVDLFSVYSSRKCTHDNWWRWMTRFRDLRLD